MRRQPTVLPFYGRIRSRTELVTCGSSARSYDPENRETSVGDEDGR